MREIEGAIKARKAIFDRFRQVTVLLGDCNVQYLTNIDQTTTIGLVLTPKTRIKNFSTQTPVW